MKRLLIGCIGLLVIIMVVAVVILWCCRPEARPLAPDEVKGYDYSATTASGAVLSATSTLSLGNSTTGGQGTISKEKTPIKSTLQKEGTWQTVLDYLTGRKRTSMIAIHPAKALRILILFNMTFIFGGLIWFGFYSADPFNFRIHPFLNFLGGAIIGVSTIWYSGRVTIFVVLAVFYVLSKLYLMKLTKMIHACLVAVTILAIITGIIVCAFRMTFG